jgi:hypothetical protein
MEKDKMCAKGDAGAEIYASLLRHGLKEPPPGVSADRRIVTKKRHYIMPVICFFFLSDFRWLFAAILFPYAAGLFRLVGFEWGGFVFLCAVALATPARRKRPEARPGVYAQGPLQEVVAALAARWSPCPWLPYGDWQTIWPFLFSIAIKKERDAEGKSLPPVRRVYLKTEDGEVQAMDWVAGSWSGTEPVAVVVPGVCARPWVAEGAFVRKTVEEVLARGWAAVVHVPRGNMGLPLSDEPFLASRTSDLSDVIDLLHKCAPQAPLCAIGWSMGAIVMTNYVANAAEDCKLVGAVSISGCNEVAALHFDSYSQRVWQPVVCRASLQNALSLGVSKLTARGVDVAELETVWHGKDFDRVFTTPYCGYDDVEEFYADVDLCSRKGVEKAQRIAVPVLFLSALDDPIFDVDTLHAPRLAKCNSNLSFILTKRGGHCGWASGKAPAAEAWTFPTGTALDFLSAVVVRSSRSSEADLNSAAGTPERPLSSEDEREDDKPRARHRRNGGDRSPQSSGDERAAPAH